MSKAAPRSPWRLPLVREVTAILLIKLALLLGIKAIWFDQPTLPENGTERLDSHLFSRPATPSSPLAEETPR